MGVAGAEEPRNARDEAGTAAVLRETPNASTVLRTGRGHPPSGANRTGPTHPSVEGPGRGGNHRSYPTEASELSA